jgi:TM2 domain-containing membrane protein YozV
MEQNICPQCGAPVDPTANSCKYCGEVFSVSTRQNTYQQQTPPPPPQYQPQQTQYQPQQQFAYPPVNPAMQKSKVAAGLLGIFLGTFGVHNFYLGYTGKAVAQLLITVLSCGFLSWISFIWGIIEGIMILSGSINIDGRGMPLKD